MGWLSTRRFAVRRFAAWLVLGSVGTWTVAGCTELKLGTPPAPGDPTPTEPAEEQDDPSASDTSASDTSDGRSRTNEPPSPEDPPAPPPIDDEKPRPIVVEELVTGRSHLGARSREGFRPWRSGLAVHGGSLFWVEGGTEPGIYSAPVTCKSASCVSKVAGLTRPSAFTATDTAIYVADTLLLKRLAFAAGSKVETVASSTTKEIVNVAVAGNDVFWTAGVEGAIRWTKPGGTTSTPIFSNGTPVAMAVAGSKVFWGGVDISGLDGLLQVMNTDGTSARGVRPVAGGFHVMRGNDTYLYYASGLPAKIHRLTLATGNVEVVAEDALGVADFAIDAKHAYWVEPGDGPDFLNGQVRRVAHDSADPETLAVSVKRPIAIAIAPKRVYVASAGTAAADWADGKILEITLP